MFEQFIHYSHEAINYAKVIGHEFAADTFEEASDMVIELVYRMMNHSRPTVAPVQSVAAT